ncbi:hypothetical protein BJV74DRAFT_597753 [Russula compacta]|nr:hypothetical protein BJV74DRAFT_597753 [Russula compacta]
MNPAGIRTALESPDMDYSSYDVTRIEPSHTSRGIAQKTIASRFVFELLWDKCIKDQVSEMQALYGLFTSSPITAPALGWLFEFRMHQLLRDGLRHSKFPSPSLLSWVRGHTLRQLFHLSPQSKLKTTYLVAPINRTFLETRDEFTTGSYYCPSDLNLTAVDSLILIHSPGEPSPVLLMFQMMHTSDQHSVDPSSLIAVNRLQVPRNTRKWYVVVTPLDIEPKIAVPTHCDYLRILWHTRSWKHTGPGPRAARP